MPRGPKGEKRPADVIGNAIKVARIATGEEEAWTDDGKDKAAQSLGRRGGKARAGEAEPKTSSRNCKRGRNVEVAKRYLGLLRTQGFSEFFFFSRRQSYRPKIGF